MNPIINSKNIKSNSEFPYLVLKVQGKIAFPHNPGFLVMHWHNDLQLILVDKGPVIVNILGHHTLTLHQGQALFINKDIAHQILPNDQASYHSFIFPDYFLKFYLSSPTQNLINKFLSSNNLEYLVFNNQSAWQIKILSILKELEQLENNKNTPTYSYEVLTQLCRIFLLLQKNIQPSYKAKLNQINYKQIRVFLSYIHQHYREKISLTDLAQAAHVSKSECLRCFHSLLNTTPYNYLLDYRLNKAANLLQNSDMPVSTIAHQIGFNQVSHFGVLFKKKTRLSPLKFRHL